MKKVLGYDIDDVFDLVGLQRRRSLAEFVFPALGLFVLAAGVGAAAGLMLAPSSGRRLRRDVTDRIEQMRGRKMKSENNATASS